MIAFYDWLSAGFLGQRRGSAQGCPKTCLLDSSVVFSQDERFIYRTDAALASILPFV